MFMIAMFESVVTVYSGCCGENGGYVGGGGDGDVTFSEPNFAVCPRCVSRKWDGRGRTGQGRDLVDE